MPHKRAKQPWRMQDTSPNSMFQTHLHITLDNSIHSLCFAVARLNGKLHVPSVIRLTEIEKWQ